MEAHSVFDRLWLGGYISRPQAYVWLASQLKVSEPEAHMSVMDEATAKRTVIVCLRRLRELGDALALATPPDGLRQLSGPDPDVTLESIE